MTVPGEPAASWQGEPPDTWSRLWRVPAVHVFRTTSSTNDAAMRLAEAGAAAGTTVIAETQTAGRGQHGRHWSDGGGRGLLLSVVLRPGPGAVDPSTMPIRLGIAVAQAIEAVTGIQSWLKWPNDVVVPNRGKLGGILCEGATGAGSPWLVAGIGINVEQTVADFADLRGQAVSLRMCDAATDRAALAGAILRAISPFTIAPPPIDGATLLLIESRDALLGREISIDGRTAGTAEGIDAEGRLLVRSGNRLDRIMAGTVRALQTQRATAQPDGGDDAGREFRLQSEAPR